MCGYGKWMVVFMWVVIFFKQKTAYEVRMSDWSSDVCSSDLHACARQRVIPDNDGAADQAERGSNGHGELETENAAGRLHGGRRIEAEGANQSDARCS